MAAPSTAEFLLQTSKFMAPIADYLRSKNTKKQSKRDQIESKGLISLSGSDVYVYDPSENQIVFFNLKNVCLQNNSPEEIERLYRLWERTYQEVHPTSELAGGEQHLGRGSPVGDGVEQNLDQVRDLPRVVAVDGAVLALGIWILIFALLY